MATVKGGLMKKQQEAQVQQEVRNRSITAIMNEMLSSSGIKGRIEELLGKRAPQFMGSLVSLVNTTPQMQQVFRDAPMTIIQAGLKAAAYDLPVDQSLGYAYVVPFYNGKSGKMEANFILGYRGMYQMAMRTGVYTKLNVIDVREGELVKWNPLTEDIELAFIEDEEEREKKKIIGYCGFFRLANGMEKYIYWSTQKIASHEKAHRKGQSQNPVWRDNYDAMCRKTIIRELIGRWGIMSIDYRTATPETMAFASAAASNTVDDEDSVDTVETETTEATEVKETLPDGRKVDPSTGEITTEAPVDKYDIFHPEKE